MIPSDPIYVNYISVGDGQDPANGNGTGFEIGSTPQTNITAQQNERINEIVANRGRIGGWVIENGMLKGGNFTIHSDGYIDINNGDLYIDGDNSLIRLGQASGNHITLDGTNKVIKIGTASVNYIVLDGVNNLIIVGPTTGDYITLDGVNQRMRSSNYVTGVSGFTIEPDLVEAQNIRARGVLQSAVFQKDIISVIGGQLMVANADVLDVDMTAADNSTLTIKGDTTFAVNDIIRLKDGTDDEWLRVTNIGSAPTYTVTRDLAGSYSANSNPAWTAGQAVVKQGVSNGTDTYSGGWLQLFGEGTNSPYYSVLSRTGVDYNDFAERVRLGNLNGLAGKSSDTYGIFIGNYSTGKYMIYDDVSGDLSVNGYIVEDTGVFGGDGSDGDLTVSVDTAIDCGGLSYLVKSYNNLTIDGTKTLSLTNTHADGTQILIKVKGDCEINGTIDVSEQGGGTNTNFQWSSGLRGTNGVNGAVNDGPGGGGGGAHQNDGVDGGGGGGATDNKGAKGTALQNFDSYVHISRKAVFVSCGGGGGTGGDGSADTPGAGGRGGGALVIEVKGDLTFGASSFLKSNGADGGDANPVSTTNNPAAGGGGAGAGGSIYVMYNGTLTDNGVTVEVNGGTGGAGGDYTGGTTGDGGAGGDGGDGDYYIVKNTVFA